MWGWSTERSTGQRSNRGGRGSTLLASLRALCLDPRSWIWPRAHRRWGRDRRLCAPPVARPLASGGGRGRPGTAGSGFCTRNLGSHARTARSEHTLCLRWLQWGHRRSTTAFTRRAVGTLPAHVPGALVSSAERHRGRRGAPGSSRTDQALGRFGPQTTHSLTHAARQAGKQVNRYAHEEGSPSRRIRSPGRADSAHWW